MPRWLKIGAAQMGPNQDGTPREAIVERMLALLEAAARDGVELIVYPEMALTTYFPKRIRQDFDQFFETEVPPKALEPLLRRAAGKPSGWTGPSGICPLCADFFSIGPGVACHFGKLRSRQPGPPSMTKC